jgi:hydroxymethylpyrimidine pyrophosphatase-like HAD family hydrolase
MRYHALAVDYDGTLAHAGLVDDATIEALQRLRKSGRRLVLVTGRLLAPLLDAFPQVGLCDLVVAENGALLYDPHTRAEQLLADALPREFVEKLAERGVPVSEVGQGILATCVPYESVTLEVIRDMSLELQIIFNKGAVMVLPSGVNKASGLRAALLKLGLSPHNAVGVGDAENDEAFLRLCETGVAVDNALDALKKQADVVVRGAAGAGVREVTEQLLADDLQAWPERPGRGALLGKNMDGGDVRLPAHGARVLVTGKSAGGKSKLAVSLLEQWIDADYQACVVDPEGDYQSVEGPIVLGALDRAPTPDEAMQVIRQPDKSCIVSLFGAKTEEQPPLFGTLLRALQDQRLRTGRPHWIVIDEAHYPIAASWAPIDELHVEDLHSVVYVTAFPEKMPAAVLKSVDLVIAVGDDPCELVENYCQLTGDSPPALQPPSDRPEGLAVSWSRGKAEPVWFQGLSLRSEHQRHQHQYFDGGMDPENRFYFRGPEAKLNLAAANLRTFMELAEGVDDETWVYHLQRGDYGPWFRDSIQDNDLAGLAEQLQHAPDVSPQDSRRQIIDLIRKLYVQEL